MIKKEQIIDFFGSDFTPFYQRYIGSELRIDKKGEVWAPCPMHDEKDASFSFKADTGVFSCFGCKAGGDIFTFYAKQNSLDTRADFRRVIDGIAADFGIADIGQKSVKPKIVNSYDYTDAGGRLIFQVVRMEPKSFRQRRPDGKGWIWNMQGVERVLYHLPEVLKAAEVVIVEGEKDADNLRALGFTATTSPGGAEKWQDRYSESLKSKRVVIMPDNDEAGKKHLAMVASSLSGAGIDPRVVIMPDGIKDVSDFIEMTSDPEQAAERIALMIEGAAPYVDETKPIGITASDLMCKSFPDVAWIVCGILSYGLWILAGKPKHGKSILAANIAIALSVAGTALGSIPVEFGRVVYLALEDTQRRLQRRLKQMVAFGGSASENLLFFTEWPRMDNGGLEELEDLIKRYHDIRLLIIDTWKLFRPPTKDSRGNLYDIDYETVSLVKKLADKYEICILLIHHFRKSESDDIFDTFSGSYGLTGAADGLLGLQRKSAGQADAILHVTGRDVEPAEYALKFIPEYLSWNLIGKADEVAATAEQQMIIEVLKNAKDTMTPKDIADGLEMKQQSVKNTLLKLKNRGLVSKEGYAKYKYIGTLSTVDTQSTVSTVSTVDSCKRTQRTF